MNKLEEGVKNNSDSTDLNSVDFLKRPANAQSFLTKYESDKILIYPIPSDNTIDILKSAYISGVYYDSTSNKLFVISQLYSGYCPYGIRTYKFFTTDLTTEGMLNLDTVEPNGHTDYTDVDDYEVVRNYWNKSDFSSTGVIARFAITPLDENGNDTEVFYTEQIKCYLQDGVLKIECSDSDITNNKYIHKVRVGSSAAAINKSVLNGTEFLTNTFDISSGTMTRGSERYESTYDNKHLYYCYEYNGRIGKIYMGG